MKNRFWLVAVITFLVAAGNVFAKDVPQEKNRTSKEQASGDNKESIVVEDSSSESEQAVALITSTSTIGEQSYISSEKFQVEPSTGSATLAIPIEVPPGRKGIQPTVALMYNSSSPNGLLGMGWSLELGCIQRSTKKGVPNYNSNDTFELVQAGSTQELVSIGANSYRAKIESAFMDFFKNGAQWIVTDKKGIKYYFGQTQDSRIFDPADPTHIFKWSLDRVEDLNGNYMMVTYYAKDATSQLYPRLIEYTGSSSSLPFASLEFQLDSRDDAFLSFRSGFAITTDKRLSEIVVRVDGHVQRGYALTYSDYSPSTGRSLLRAVTQYASDGSALPSTTFNYTEFQSEYPWGEVSWSFPSSSRFNVAARVVDINHDGQPDVMKYSNGENSYNYTFINTDWGWTLTSNEWRPLPDNRNFYYWPPSGPHDSGVRLADVNGDGWQDVVAYLVKRGCFGTGIGYRDTYLNDRSSYWTHDNSWILPEEAYIGMLCGDCYQDWSDTGGVLLQDVNGDGLTDIAIARPHNGHEWCSRDYNHNVWLNTGSGWQQASYTTPADAYFTGDPQTYTPLVDINGDGLPDIIFAFEGGPYKTYLNTGNGWHDFGTYALPDGDLADGTSTLADINADSLPDLLIIDGSTRCCYLNFNGTWVQNDTYAIPDGQFNNSTTRLFDANADGLVDVVRNDSSALMSFNYGPVPDVLYRFSNGIGATTEITYTPSSAYDNTGDDDVCDLPFPLQVVSSVTATDQVVGQSYTTDYEYRDGYFDFQQREFRGFGWAKTMDVEGSCSETEFLQGEYTKGRIIQQATYDSAGNLFAKVVNEWEEQDLGNGSHFVYLHRTDNFILNGNATGKRTRAEYTYGSYGNVLVASEFGEVDFVTGEDIGSDKRDTYYNYTVNPSAWLVSLPSYVFVYDSGHALVKQSSFYYDDNAVPEDPPVKGLLTKQEAWLDGSDNPTAEFTYDSYGNLLTTTDTLNHTTTIMYDSTYALFPLVAQNTAGHEVINEYYGIDWVPLDDGTYHGLWGQLKSTTGPNGNTSYSLYDSFGRIEKQISSEDSIDFPTIRYEYNLSSTPIAISSYQREISGESSTLDAVSFYDGLGRAIQTKTESEEEGRFVVSGQTEFNSRGLPYKKYLPFFASTPIDSVDPINSAGPHTTFAYDAMGRVTQSTNPDGTYATIAYGDWVTSAIDENGHMQKSYVDAYGRLIKKEEYTGADGRSPHYPYAAYSLYATTEYAYDTLGNLISTTDAHGNTTTINYDTLGRKTSMSDPDMGQWGYEYDALGNLLQQTDAKGQEIAFGYDELNRLTSKTSPSDPTVNYTYDDSAVPYSKGRLTKAAYAGSDTTKFFYDMVGREIKSEKKIDGLAHEVQRTYDTAGRLLSVVYPDDELVQYAYNAAGYIEQVTTTAPAQIPIPAEIAVDNVSSMIAGSQGQYFLSHEVGTGDNRVLIVGVSSETYASSAEVSSVISNGTPLTKIVDTVQYHERYNRSDMWYLLNPQPGEHSIAITIEGGSMVCLTAAAVSLTGVAQQPPQTYATAHDIGNSPSVAISTVSEGAWIIDNLSTDFSWCAISPDSDQVELYNVFQSGKMRGGGSYKAFDAGSTSMDWNISCSTGWALVAASFAPAEVQARAQASAYITSNRIGQINKSASALTSIPVEIAIDNVSSMIAGSQSQYLLSHEVGTGDNRILVVGVSPESDSSSAQVASVTANGVPLTKITEAVHFHERYNSSYLWYLLDPQPGEYTIAITIEGGTMSCLTAGAVSLTGVAQQPPETNAIAHAKSSSPSISINASTDGAWIIDNLSTDFSWCAISPDNDQGELYNVFQSGMMRGGGSYKEMNTGSTTMDWNISCSTGWALVAASFAPAEEDEPPEDPPEDPPEILDIFVENVDYSAAGQIVTIEYGNGVVTAYTYDVNTLRLIHLSTVDSEQVTLQELNYHYDSVGNIVQIIDNVNTATQIFTYDALNRLLTADSPGYGFKEYEYDQIGNMIFKDGVVYSYGAGSAGPHAVTSGSDGSVFTYDNNGNMNSWQTADGRIYAYEFDAENRLRIVKINGATKAAYEYDGDGGRTKKTIYSSSMASRDYFLHEDSFAKRRSEEHLRYALDFLSSFVSIPEAEAALVSEVTTVYIGSLYEKTDNSNTKHIFLGGQRIASVKDGVVNYFHTNHLGSTDVVTDYSGEEIVHYEYAPYGEVVVEQGVDITDYKFTGKSLDSEVGLYFYGARYYNPTIGRFITADSIVQESSDSQSLNRYTYGRGNPGYYTDPNGHWFWAALIVGSILGGTSAAINDQPIWQGVLMGAAGGLSVGFGSAAFGFGGAVGGGMLAGGANSAVFGGDIGLGVLTGGLGAGLGYGLGSWAGGWNEGSFWGGLGAAAISGGVAGGAGAEFAGGDFGEGAWMGAAFSTGGFFGAKAVNGLDPRVSKARQYEREVKRRHNLNVAKNDKVKISGGSRPVILGARHKYIEGWEMGPQKSGGDPITTTNTAKDLSKWPTYKHTVKALANKTADPFTMETSFSGMVDGIDLYNSYWVDKSSAYSPISHNSNYAVNTVVYSSGGSVPGGLGWCPQFNTPPDSTSYFIYRRE
ncbi:toxin TcdB middle/N-terminal domain-containing protein [Candidatus Omnitrophota bacterium]